MRVGLTWQRVKYFKRLLHEAEDRGHNRLTIDIDCWELSDLLRQASHVRNMTRALHAIKAALTGMFLLDRVARWLDWLEFTGVLTVDGPSVRDLEIGVSGLGPKPGWPDPDGNPPWHPESERSTPS